jgi:hypothetical protein
LVDRDIGEGGDQDNGSGNATVLGNRAWQVEREYPIQQTWRRKKVASYRFPIRPTRQRPASIIKRKITLFIRLLRKNDNAA